MRLNPAYSYVLQDIKNYELRQNQEGASYCMIHLAQAFVREMLLFVST